MDARVKPAHDDQVDQSATRRVFPAPMHIVMAGLRPGHLLFL
jgi:hypothetical protein